MLKQLTVAALAGLAVAQQAPSFADALSSTAELSMLKGVVPKDVLQTLSSVSNVTLLAPSNTAFGRISPQELSALTANPGLITAILQYHVINGSYPASAIPKHGTFLPTLLNDKKYTNVTGGQVVHVKPVDKTVVFFSGNLTNSTVTTANIEFSGGVIHVIDNLLSIPGLVSDIATAAGLTAISGALTQGNFVETVNTTPDLTIFAPTDLAFKNIGSALPNLTPEELTKVLSYHVVAGTVGYSSRLTNGTSLKTANGANVTITIDDNNVYVNNAKVVIADVLVANGVVHVIDEVLNPNNATATKPADEDNGAPAFGGASPVTSPSFAQPNATIGGNATRPTSTGLPEATTNAAPSMPAGAAGLTALLGAAVAFFL